MGKKGSTINFFILLTGPPEMLSFCLSPLTLVDVWTPVFPYICALLDTLHKYAHQTCIVSTNTIAKAIRSYIQESPWTPMRSNEWAGSRGTENSVPRPHPPQKWSLCCSSISPAAGQFKRERETDASYWLLQADSQSWWASMHNIQKFSSLGQCRRSYMQ